MNNKWNKIYSKRERKKHDEEKKKKPTKMRNENKTMNVCLGYNWVRRKTAHNNNIFIHVANSIL